MNRRKFILSGIGLGALPLINLPAWAGMDHSAHGGHASNAMPQSLKTVADMPLLLESALPAGQMHQPLALLKNTSSQSHKIVATLTAAAHEVELVAGKKTTMWLYNGQVPGPLIEAFEGDEVEIRFINQLAQASTIHWHGLPVPPEQDGNPHDAVPAGGEHVYRF
ncbi:MAG: multicopper oxidase domain-containing protein, partial [Deefgea sp.]